TAFFTTRVGDNNSYEQWQLEGEKRNEQRANTVARKWLDSYVQPELDPAIDEALLEFIAKKKDSMPDAFA
ncbi:MAG: trimethylamine methyltransferase family protein, partial [Rhizobiaceae bacterium]|nr:trimethylamine methyltransferase family protein [Rhizobiaceae bacterium]